MKINRLIETVLVLLQKDSITAKELAARFHVSARTIYRDVEILSSSGIPVHMDKGYGGGISIMDQYKLPKTLLSEEERRNLLFALQAFRATDDPNSERTLSKLTSLFQMNTANWITIDFTAWSTKTNGMPKLLEIKRAILEKRCIRFSYINAHNEKSFRTIEPMQLQYKARDWYLYGWDVDKKSHRLFKITRIKNFIVTSQLQKNDGMPVADQLPTAATQYEFVFSPSVLYRLYDYYEEDQIRENEDGSYTVVTEYPETLWLYEHLLSFGPYVRVTAPAHVRDEHRRLVEKMRYLY